MEFHVHLGARRCGPYNAEQLKKWQQVQYLD